MGGGGGGGAARLGVGGGVGAIREKHSDVSAKGTGLRGADCGGGVTGALRRIAPLCSVFLRNVRFQY